MYFLGFGQALHHHSPIEGGVVDILLQVEVLQGLLAELAEGDNLLAINAIGGRIIEMRQVGFLGLQGVAIELEVVEHAYDVFLQIEIVEGFAWGVP